MDYDTFKLFVGFDKRLKSVETIVNKIWTAVQLLQQEELQAMATVQQIVEKVTEVQGAEDSTIALLDAIHAMLVDVKAQLVAAGVDATALDGVMATLDANKQKLGDAVARNPIPE